MFIKIFLKWHLITLLILVLSIIIFYLKNPPLPNVELNKCPACYGTDLCNEFDSGQINLSTENLTEKLQNFISVKNTMFGYYNNDKIVMKKLAHDWELEEIDARLCKTLSENGVCDLTNLEMNDEDLESVLAINVTDLHGIICEPFSVLKFKNQFGTVDNNVLWFTLKMNPEPLILQIFRRQNGWPVPRYYGACGRYVVIEHCGRMLNEFHAENWFARANLALQLLEAAIMFTNAHPTYRLYLIDVSPDNIVVDINDRIRFIDLEHVILKEKNDKESLSEYISENLEDCNNCFSFSRQEICFHDTSDVNYYTICKLILSPNAPWPMMDGGLLHSMPFIVKDEHSELLTLIDKCVNPSQGERRQNIVLELVNKFEVILNDKDNY